MTNEQRTCGVCGRDPKHMNNAFAECSHSECPHRKSLTAFGIGTDDLTLSVLVEGEDSSDPKPLTRIFK